MNTVGIWLAAIGTLGIYSFLYRDNPLYRVVEQILVGLSVGYLVVVTVKTTLIPKVATPLGDGNLTAVVALILALMMFARIVPRFSRLARIPLAVVVGAGAGLSIPALLKARVLVQMGAIIAAPGVNVIVGAVGVIATLAYFYFSKPHKGWFGGVARLGTWYLMVFFGATFGYTIMSRLSLLIGRTEFLLGPWLGLLR